MRLPLSPHPALLSAIVLAGAPVAAAELALEPCQLPGVAVPARCGTYEVFEDREGRTGRTIPLRIAVLSTARESRRASAIVPFAGGPGESTVSWAAGVAGAWARLLEERDILLVDYRGTGSSNPLFCPYQEEGRGVDEALASFLPIELVDDCREALTGRADLTQYTTPNIVDDVDEVRRVLGYETVDLFGASYGTRAVLVYLRRHPEAVRTAAIEGVVPTDARMPVSLAGDSQAALDGWLRECAEDAGCAAAFPDPAGDLARALARLEPEAPTLEVVDPRSGETVPLHLTRNAFVQALRYMLYTPLNALKIPAYLHAAAEGDWAPMAQTAYTVGGLLMASVPDGLYLSVTCTEDVAAIGPNAAALQAGTFLGDFRLRQQQAACAEWPVGDLPEGFYEPILSDVPVLIVSGERDPATPVRWARQVQEFLPASAHVVVPDGAHAWFGLDGAQCLEELHLRLVETGGTAGLDVEACRSSIARPPFLLAIPRDAEVAMTPAELERYAGSYTLEGGGFRVLVELTGDGLVAAFGESTRRLIPLGSGRFTAAGEAPGRYYDFVEEEGRIIRLEVVEGGTTRAALLRDDG